MMEDSDVQHAYKEFEQNLFMSQMRVAHTCNPSYSGDSDQEDGCSKPGQASSSVKPYFEKPFTIAWGDLSNWISVWWA
jgi:hypothetical protein